MCDNMDVEDPEHALAGPQSRTLGIVPPRSQLLPDPLHDIYFHGEALHVVPSPRLHTSPGQRPLITGRGEAKHGAPP